MNVTWNQFSRSTQTRTVCSVSLKNWRFRELKDLSLQVIEVSCLNFGPIFTLKGACGQHVQSSGSYGHHTDTKFCQNGGGRSRKRTYWTATSCTCQRSGSVASSALSAFARPSGTAEKTQRPISPCPTAKCATGQSSATPTSESYGSASTANQSWRLIRIARVSWCPVTWQERGQEIPSQQRRVEHQCFVGSGCHGASIP